MSVQESIRKALEEVTVECGACGAAFETARVNICGIMFCDDCEDGYDRASDDVFESALWAKAGPNEVR
jgi:hypothetical protein